MKMFSPQEPVQEGQPVIVFPDVIEIDLERWWLAHPGWFLQGEA
jgi:hypothetical protein